MGGVDQKAVPDRIDAILRCLPYTADAERDSVSRDLSMRVWSSRVQIVPNSSTWGTGATVIALPANPCVEKAGSPTWINGLSAWFAQTAGISDPMGS